MQRENLGVSQAAVMGMIRSRDHFRHAMTVSTFLSQGGYLVPNNKLLTWPFMIGVVLGDKELPRSDVVGRLAKYPKAYEFGANVLYSQLVGFNPPAGLQNNQRQLPRRDVASEISRFFPRLTGRTVGYIDRNYMHAVLEHKVPGFLRGLLQEYRNFTIATTRKYTVPEQQANLQPRVEMARALTWDIGRPTKLNRRAINFIEGREQNQDYIGRFG